MPLCRLSVWSTIIPPIVSAIRRLRKRKLTSMIRKLTAREAARLVQRAPKSATRDAAIRKAIRSIPRGKVATYSQVAAAAGYPLYHRQVAQLLRGAGGSLPLPRGGGGRGGKQ